MKMLLVCSACLGLVVWLGTMARGDGAHPVHFLYETLAMNPEIAADGARVTFSFQVRNDGPAIDRVQIRVVEPADSRGQGQVLVDVTNQRINAGLNTYRVSGTFHRPDGGKNGVIVNLLDRRTATLPAPVLAGSGYRQLQPAGFKLAPYVPLI